MSHRRVCMLAVACWMLLIVLAFSLPLSAEGRPSSAGSSASIHIAPGVAVVAVATAADATARERLAADEIAAYLQRIAGPEPERIELAEDGVGEGVIAVGELALRAGIIAQEELDAVAGDGYVVRVAEGRAGICGWRDVGTVYGAYALLQELGVRFYAPGCEVVPARPNLMIPEFELSAAPHYEWRGMTDNMKLGQTPDDDVGDPGEIDEPGSWVHSADFLVPFDTYS